MLHALSSLLHYVVALREGIDPVKLGLAKEGDKAYIPCIAMLVAAIGIPVAMIKY